MNLSDELIREYQHLYDTVMIRQDWAITASQSIEYARHHQARYERASKPFLMPWQVVAAIHALEASGNFECHLHNGDSLRKRTRNVPAGRPFLGSPPFTWEQSAEDALRMKRPEQYRGQWDIPHTLYFLEAYNGFGYRKYHPRTKTPYLWSGTTHYGPPYAPGGKYVADGKWDPSAVSEQIGAVVILNGLGFKGENK